MSSSEIWRRSSRRWAVMPSAPACAASARGAHRIGIPAAARVPDGGDVVDIDAEAQSRLIVHSVQIQAISRARSTELIAGVARKAAMMLVRCLHVAAPRCRPASRRNRAAVGDLEIGDVAADSCRSRSSGCRGCRARWRPSRLMRPTWALSSSGSSFQATSSQRSGVSAKLASVSQSMVWMVTPLPVVTMPTMRSPGSGWQQPAKCIAMPGIRPRIGTAGHRSASCRARRA